MKAWVVLLVTPDEREIVGIFLSREKAVALATEDPWYHVLEATLNLAGMRAWVVLDVDTEGSALIGVFSTEEKARNVASQGDPTKSEGLWKYDVRELKLDVVVPENER